MDSSSFIISLLKEIVAGTNIQLVPAGDNISGGYLLFSSGRKVYFLNSRWDINLQGSAKVVNDKSLTIKYLTEASFSTTKGVLVCSADDIYAYTNNLEFPLVAKPNTGNQGKDVFLVERFEDLDKILKNIFINTDKVRIEEKVMGKHLSFSVFNDEIYSVYEKKPFSSGEVLEDYTDHIDVRVRDYIIRSVQVFSLKLASVDVVCKAELDIAKPKDFVIIEINSAPSFRLYGSYNSKARNNIKKLYKNMIDYLNN